MKKLFYLTLLAMFLASTTGIAMAQMMGGGQHMYGSPAAESGEQEASRARQQGYPGMMGGYGSGMPPGMMGYGMGPGMMGGCGCGSGPAMMGHGWGVHHGPCGGYGMWPGMMGHGYGLPQGMMGYGMGGYGQGMGPGMMGPGQWGGCGGWYPGAKGEYAEKYNKALDETQELRRKLHALKFEYNEALRNPEIPTEKKQEMAQELHELNEQIHRKMHE